jgi:hypothetical protein
MNYTFLSAHFDDAIGSCGETIIGFRRAEHALLEGLDRGRG